MNSILSRLSSWLDHRTGYRAFVHEALYERIPGGARWRYVWGSTLTFVFAVQLITGVFLWAAYSPSTLTAWESVYHIQYETEYGWLVRGIHHYAAQAMMILLAMVLLPSLGVAAKGARRWLRWGSISIQPAEMVKLVSVIYLAAYLAKK